ncbi:MAG TPA: hypothetical protein VGN55_06425 [Xanthobacteraceae bacterium]
MVQRVDYYALLSRAVESLERDAYAARGAIYDREHKALLKRLISSSSPCTDADIVREEQAFRDAIRQIEFPDDEPIQAPRTPQREPEAPWPGSAREKARALRRQSPPEPANDPERTGAGDAKRAAWPRRDAAYEERKPPGSPREPSLGNPEEDEPGWYGEERKSRSLIKLAVAYVLVAAIVVGAGALGYAYVAGAVDLSWLTSWSGPAAPQVQRAILYEGGQAGRGTGVEGKAIWRTRMEPNGAGGKADMVVTLDVEIPQPHIALTMTLSREGNAGAGMSHLLELRFAKPEELPFGGITRISNIAMKGAPTEAGESLVGTSINIAPGQFMFGLLGVEDVVKQNVQRLRTQSWLDLIVVFANGATYTLSIEKGAAGERALNEALAKWGQ